MAMTEDEVCRVLEEKLALRKGNENPERPGKEAVLSEEERKTNGPSLS